MEGGREGELRCKCSYDVGVELKGERRVETAGGREINGCAGRCR